MLKNFCSDVGLGFSQDIFTTNSIKRLNYKESEWPEFNKAMKKLVLSQSNSCFLWSRSIPVR